MKNNIYKRFINCGLCDKKDKASIDRELDKYIEVDGTYMHCDCYKKSLTDKKNNAFSEDEANDIVKAIYSEQKEELDNCTREIKNKEELIEFLMEYYESSLPKKYIEKLDGIADGSKVGLRDAISYQDMLEFYSTDEFQDVLDRIHLKGYVKKPYYHYDLEVMITKYEEREKELYNWS